MNSSRWLKTMPSPLSKSQPTPELLRQLESASAKADSRQLRHTLDKLHLEDSDGDDEGRAIMSATDSAFGVEEIGRIDFVSYLPAELAVKVLSFVDQIEELKVISLVSQTWHNLAQDNEVWKAHFFARWGRPKAIQKTPFVPRNWRSLYESRLMLNAQWKSPSPVITASID
jgi:hypothetical protein